MIAVVFALCAFVFALFWALVFAIIVIIRYKAKYDQSSIEADHWEKLHILMKSDYADAHAFINRMDIRNSVFHEIERASLHGERDIFILNYDITVCEILAKEFKELGYYTEITTSLSIYLNYPLDSKSKD